MDYEDVFYKIDDIFYFNPLRELFYYTVVLGSGPTGYTYEYWCCEYEQIHHWKIGTTHLHPSKMILGGYNQRTLNCYTNFQSTEKYYFTDYAWNLAQIRFEITPYVSYRRLYVGMVRFLGVSDDNTTVVCEEGNLDDVSYNVDRVVPTSGYKKNTSTGYFININDTNDFFKFDQYNQYSDTPLLVGLNGFQQAH